MLLLSRTILTNYDQPRILPILQEFSSLCKARGVPMNVWLGGAGYVMGTVIITAAYKSEAERFNGKLISIKEWWDVHRKFREYIISVEPDVIYNFVRGGESGIDNPVPLGTIIKSSSFQMAQGADWLGTLKYLTEYAEMSTKITGVDVNVVHARFGVLGDVGMFSSYPDFVHFEAARVKQGASTELRAKFIEGAKFAMAGTIMQRLMVKVA